MPAISLIQNSIAVPPHTYECDEYFSRFKPRINQRAELADAGSWQCQLDFLESSHAARAGAARNVSTKSYAVGCINPIVGNFSALCACEALPERLALTTYIIEYAYIHDDVIEYAEDKSEDQLWKANQELTEGLNMDEESERGTKDHVRRRQLQAKMAVELLDMEKVQGKEVPRLWKEMSDIFVEIRDLDFQKMDDYLRFRAVDAGCPWTMSLLCFSMNFALSDEESTATSAVTHAAYDAWVLVNDYFSWEKEWKNHEANGETGMIVSAVFLFMKWHSVNASKAKALLREEIIAREKKFIRAKEDFLTRGKVTEKLMQWLELLDLVTAGNFAWSMTTARYQLEADDAYPRLRNAHKENPPKTAFDSLSTPISFGTVDLAKLSQTISGTTEGRADAVDSPLGTTPPAITPVEELPEIGEMQDHPLVPVVPSLYLYEERVLEPEQYIASLPSKGVRNSVIDGLEVWYQVPDKSLAVIRDIISLLHSSSLMIDDIEDGSLLRRGSPSTHTVFGVNRTINAANLLMVKAVKAAASLSPEAANILTDRVIEAHLGQGLDLHWTFHTEVPTEDEYFSMVDGKTGGIFILLGQLMRSEATVNKHVDVFPLMRLFSRFYQARDDYQNLESTEYTKQKGLAEDISEGKISLPLIHAMKTNSVHRGRIMSILQLRKTGTPLSEEVLKMAVDAIRATGGVDYARKVATRLQETVDASLSAFEARMGAKNYILRLVQKKLELDE